MPKRGLHPALFAFFGKKAVKNHHPVAERQRQERTAAQIDHEAAAHKQDLRAGDQPDRPKDDDDQSAGKPADKRAKKKSADQPQNADDDISLSNGPGRHGFMLQDRIQHIRMELQARHKFGSRRGIVIEQAGAVGADQHYLITERLRRHAAREHIAVAVVMKGPGGTDEVDQDAPPRIARQRPLRRIPRAAGV